MVSDHRVGAGFKHVVREFNVTRLRGGRVLNAPVNRNQQQIALRACRFDGIDHRGFRQAGTFGVCIRNKCHVRQVVFVGIVMAIEPARHSQPANLDSVLLDDHRFQRDVRGLSRADKHQVMLAKMVDGFGKAALSLIEDVVVGERDDLDAAGFQRIEQNRRRVKLKSLCAERVRGRNRRLKIHEADVGFEENVRYSREESVPTAMIAGHGCAVLRGIFLVCGLVQVVRVGGLDYGLVWNHIAGGGESDAADLAWIRSSGGSLSATSPADKGKSEKDKYDTKRGPAQRAVAAGKISDLHRSLLSSVTSLHRQFARRQLSAKLWSSGSLREQL